MNILETLHLRMAGDDLDDLVEMVQGVTGPQGHSPLVSIFRHSRVQGDLLIHICWNGPEQTAEPSELGLRLASLLRIHGLVEHSVWVRGGNSQDTA
jgi:hypothetical protein